MIPIYPDAKWWPLNAGFLSYNPGLSVSQECVPGTGKGSMVAITESDIFPLLLLLLLNFAFAFYNPEHFLIADECKANKDSLKAVEGNEHVPKDPHICQSSYKCKYPRQSHNEGHLDIQ